MSPKTDDTTTAGSDVHGAPSGARAHIPVDTGDPDAIPTVGDDDPIPGSSVDANGRPRIDIPGRPEDLPDNFDSVADLVAAHKAGQQKITELSTPTDDKTPAGDTPTGEPTAENLSGSDISTLMDEAEVEFSNTGDITVTTKAKLEAAGLTPARLARFIKGVEAQGREEMAELHRAAGGETLMQTMFAWASDNLQVDELGSLNASLEAGGTMATQAVRALSNVYHASVGKVPTLLTGSTSGPSEGMDVYPEGEEGRREMVMDMRKPEYRDHNNVKFRRMVDAKIDRSKI